MRHSGGIITQICKKWNLIQCLYFSRCLFNLDYFTQLNFLFRHFTLYRISLENNNIIDTSYTRDYSQITKENPQIWVHLTHPIQNVPDAPIACRLQFVCLFDSFTNALNQTPAHIRHFYFTISVNKLLHFHNLNIKKKSFGQRFGTSAATVEPLLGPSLFTNVLDVCDALHAHDIYCYHTLKWNKNAQKLSGFSGTSSRQRVYVYIE